MLPIAIDPTALRIGLAGAGEARKRRQAFLAQGGVAPVSVAPGSSTAGLHLLFVAGLSRPDSESLAAQARAHAVLVNVEDVPELCDFHVPAVLRRGDLAFAVSTNGRAPALSRLLREWLDRAFGIEWKERIESVSAARIRWRTEGHFPADVSRLTRDMVAREGWLE